MAQPLNFNQQNLSQSSSFPQMGAAFSGWQQSITLQKVIQRIVDGDKVETLENTTFNGTVQPYTPDQLELQEQGDRNWQWLQIHCFTGDANLKVNNKIIFNDVRYKVFKILDYSLNNYIEYRCVEDYQG